MFSNNKLEASLLFLSVRKFLVKPVPSWKCWPKNLKTKIKNVLRTGLTSLWESIAFISWSINLQKYLPKSLNLTYEGNQSFQTLPLSNVNSYTPSDYDLTREILLYFLIFLMASSSLHYLTVKTTLLEDLRTPLIYFDRFVAILTRWIWCWHVYQN